MQTSNSERIKTHLLYSWFVYAIIIVAAVFLWSALLTSITTPHGKEKLAVFFGAQQVDGNALEQKLSPLLDETVKLVNVDYACTLDDNFSYIFSTRGMINTDIVVLPESYLPVEQLSSCFVPIDKTLIAQYLPQESDVTFLEYAGIAYGIRVFDGTNGILTDNVTYCNESENTSFYLFFNASSVNLGSMNTKGNSNDDLALRALTILFG